MRPPEETGVKDTLVIGTEAYDSSAVVVKTLGIHKMTLSRWVKLEKFRPLKIGNRHYFSRREIERALVIGSSIFDQD
jgi:hypothetical protein